MTFSGELKNVDQWAALWTPLALRVTTALLILLLGKWLAELLRRVVQRVLTRSRGDEILSGFVASICYGVGMALVVLAALSQLGVNTNSAAAVLGGAVLAVGLSLQNQLASFAAGVLLIVTRPFRKGDSIQAAGVSGTVEKLDLIHTTLRTLENHQVTLPNSSVFGSVLINYTALPERRLDLTLPLDHAADLARAKQLVRDILAAEARVLKEPAPTVEVRALTAAGVDLAVRPWVKSEDAWTVQCALLERIKLNFDAAGIRTPQNVVQMRAERS